jgi:predicted Rossmann-fold nucleotide-binding protein
VLLSDAYVVVPGGIGTVLEATLVWQLLQVRYLHDTPLVFVGDMWGELVSWARRYMLRPGLELANPEDMAIPRCVTTADEATAIIRDHQARWGLAQEGRQ